MRESENFPEGYGAGLAGEHPDLGGHDLAKDPAKDAKVDGLSFVGRGCLAPFVSDSSGESLEPAADMDTEHTWHYGKKTRHSR